MNSDGNRLIALDTAPEPAATARCGNGPPPPYLLRVLQAAVCHRTLETKALVAILGQKPTTVHTYLQLACKHLGVGTRFEAVEIVRANGWLWPEEDSPCEGQPCGDKCVCIHPHLYNRRG